MRTELSVLCVWQIFGGHEHYTVARYSHSAVPLGTMSIAFMQSSQTCHKRRDRHSRSWGKLFENWPALPCNPVTSLRTLCPCRHRTTYK